MKESISLLLTLVLAVGVEVTNADFTFGEAANPGPPINTPYDDYNVTLSADGLELYVSADRPGGLGFYDIWSGTRESADHPWGSLVNVQEINSRYNETFPSLSSDGLTLYFSDWYYWNAAGDRPVGVGHHDLWMSTRPSIYDSWGPPVNSPAHDCEVCFSPDGLALFFCSNHPGGMGSYDMWLTTRRSQAAAWNPPVNLGPLINTSGMEGAPSLSPDLRTLYFGSDKPGGTGGWEMYEVPIVPILDFNGDGMVETCDLLLLIESWGQDDPTVDIGPAPWGDGVVNAVDLEILMSHWGQEIDDPTLVAHWALDEVHGTIAHGGGADWDGVLLGDPTW